jgi:hypothetical protein
MQDDVIILFENYYLRITLSFTSQDHINQLSEYIRIKNKSPTSLNILEFSKSNKKCIFLRDKVLNKKESMAFQN